MFDADNHGEAEAAATSSGSDTNRSQEATSNASLDRASLARALRELEATEARVERNARLVYDEARGKLVMELLPVLDNLDRTIRAAANASDPALLEGVRMVRGQLESVLVRYGAERIEATLARFDPAIHEAIAVIPVSDPELHGGVIDQVEPGYRFAGKLLRPAKVTVGKLQAPAVEPRGPVEGPSSPRRPVAQSVTQPRRPQLRRSFWD